MQHAFGLELEVPTSLAEVAALHQGVDDPDEFRVYETWESPEAVGRHESGPRFLTYKERIRPLVDGSTVLWGNAGAFAVRGYGPSTPPGTL